MSKKNKQLTNVLFEPYWNILKNNLYSIINESDYYLNIFNFIVNYEYNTLLYGIYGFPTDLFIDEIIKKKFNIKYIYRNNCIWNKNIVYNENQYFFEIDLLNPSMPKDFNFISDFVLHIIKNKNIDKNKHFIIIKHIDMLSNDFFVLRILLEKFSSNAYFLCTTHKLSKIENPIKSRFTIFRMPLFTHETILHIFKKYLNISLNKYLIKYKTRDIIKSIFIAEVERQEPDIITEEFCNFNLPILYTSINNKLDLSSIRTLSYKCFQYNINISQITLDLLKIIKNKDKHNLVKISSDLDYYLNITNKGREPIYIETLLCNALL